MSRLLSGGTRLLAISVAVILAVGVLQPRLASAAASIMLNPTSGQIGTPVNVTGSGFEQNEIVNITFHNSTNFGVVASPVASGSGGSFATQFNVPAGATPGTYTVTATGATSGRVANAPFQVFNGPVTTLTISKSVSNPTNGVLQYTISYANTGANTALGVEIDDPIQPGQSLLVNSLSTGCTYNAPGGQITVVCVPNSGSIPASGQPGSSGTFTFSTQIQAGFSGTIYNSATITSQNAASQTSNTTSVVVNGGGGNPGPTSLQKTVEDNNTGFFATSVNANPGDVITYDLAYLNTSTTSTALGVTITDTLQPGQTYLGPPFSSSNCAPVGGNTISCPIGNVAPNTRVDVFISASVNSNTPGATINNQARATSQATTISSNTTSVIVSGSQCNVSNTCCVNSNPNTCCVNGGNNCCASGFNNCCFNGFTNGCTLSGNFVLCGLVTSYTGTSVTINGVTVQIVPGAAVTGPPTTGSNECVTFALNSSAQATALAVSSNLAGAGVACGFYGGTSASGILSVTGIGVPLAPTATFQPTLVLGGFYCFLLNGSGQAFNVLSGVPTSLLNADVGGHTQTGAEKLL